MRVDGSGSDSSGRVGNMQRAALAAMVIVGVALRLGLGWVHPYMFDDSRDYVALAQRILQGLSYGVDTRDGWMTASRMPGYPVFVAGVFAVFGESVRAVACVQAVASAGIIWLAWLIGRRAGVTAGLIAAGLVAVDPLTVGFSAAILSEMPFTLCLMVGVWICGRLMERGGFGWWVVLGAVWGVAVYLRGSVIWLIVPLALWVCVVRRRGWMVAGAGVAVALMFAVLAPWLVGNGQGLRLTSLEGISLYEAVYPGADGGPKQDKIALPEEMRGLSEWQRDAEWNRRAWGYVRSDPLRMARLAVVKMGRTWSPWMNAAEMKSGLVQAGLIAWQIPLFIFAVWGIFRGRLAGRMKGLLVIPLVYFTAVHSVFLGSVRYRVPLMPLVCVLAALGIDAVVRRLGKRPGNNGV